MRFQKRFILLIKPLFFMITPIFANNAMSFLTITDIHLNDEQKHIMPLDPSSFNPNNNMDKLSFLKITSVIKKSVGHDIPTPKFVLHLGDIVRHQRGSSSKRTEFVERNEREVFLRLQQIFSHIPIINVFGNNDSFDRNYGDFTFKGKSPYSIAIKSGFRNGFLSTGKLCNTTGIVSTTPCLLNQNQKYGFFTIKLQNKLLLIGLNTVMLSPSHSACLKQVRNQMNYLRKQLKQAKACGISLLIAMHIPVGNNVYDGSPFWRKTYQTMFLKMIRSYHDQIAGILAGHTHMEEFKIIKVANGQNIGEYFTAGLSTSHGNSPSVKVFKMEYHGRHWIINNYTTYQIHKKSGKITLSKYYDFVNAYCKKLPISKSINNCLSDIKFCDILPRYTVNNLNYRCYKAQSPKSLYVNL